MKSCILVIVALFLSLLSGSLQAQTAVLKGSDTVSLELKVPAEDAPNVSAVYPISAQGTIKLPYLGEIRAAGMSTTDLARRVEAAYRAAEIYTNPTVVVNLGQATGGGVGAAHIVTVGGEVKSGGREVPLRDRMRLYQAIMAAGGLTEFADPKKVRLMRGNRSQVFDIRKIQDNGSNNPILMDGDTIHIPQ